LIIFSSCNFKDKTSGKVAIINFSDDSAIAVKNAVPDTVNRLKVAVAAIISPRETFRYYEDLLKYVSGKIDYKIEFKQRKTYEEVNRLVENQEVDIAFICSGAYVEGKDQNTMELLAVPVCNGHPFYQAYVIVHNSSTIQSFNDLKGKSFAYTDPMSNTGKLYAEKRIHELRFSENSFFKNTVFTYAHDVSIQLVAKQMVDGATVDGLIFDYLKVFHPERVKNIRIIEKSENFGIPPVVVPIGLNAGLKAKLRDILLTMHLDTSGKEILDKLLIEKFLPGNDAEYNSLRKIKQVIKK
jgi:phosphonate transport system substrate-binding protein